MKLSFTTMTTPGLGVLTTAKLALRYGYDGIDIRISNHLGELTINSSNDEISEVKDILSSEGIMLSGLLCYNKSGGIDGILWQEMKESLQRHLELAYQLGSPSIRIFAGNPLEFKNQDDFIKKTADVISYVLEHEKSEVNILLQNHLNGFTAKQAVKLVEMVGKPRFGIVFSPDHCVLQQEDPIESYDALRKYSKQLYLADLISEGSEYKCRLPGEGSVQLKAALQALGGVDFDGWVTFKWEKIWHEELEEAEIALPFFIDYMCRSCC